MHYVLKHRWLLLAMWLIATLWHFCTAESREYKRWHSPHFPLWACREVAHLSVQGRHCGAAVLGSCNQNVTDKLLCRRWVLLSLVILALQVWLQQISVWDPPLHSLCCTLAIWGLTPKMSVAARLTCWNPGSLLSADQPCSALHTDCGTTITACPQSHTECWSTKHCLSLSKKDLNYFQAQSCLLAAIV